MLVCVEIRCLHSNLRRCQRDKVRPCLTISDVKLSAATLATLVSIQWISDQLLYYTEDIGVLESVGSRPGWM